MVLWLIPWVAEASAVPKARHERVMLVPSTLPMVLSLKLDTNLAGGNSGTLTRGDYQRKPQS